jgi:hypothetical protein
VNERRSVYEVTEEFYVHNGRHGTREDVVFLINGIPVLVIECKNANKDEELQKFILRQHQATAVDKVVSRALNPKLTRGLVWHTQGSGKTYTLVAVDREACVFYKEALDAILPPEYSEIVFTGNNNDPAHLKKWHLDEKRERAIRKDFAKLKSGALKGLRQDKSAEGLFSGAAPAFGPVAIRCEKPWSGQKKPS